MGKGYNNYMTKKPFHPGSKANIKRTWMAEQRAENEKRKQEDLKTQYEKEQDLYNNRALLSAESKDKLELNFMYEAPPGAKRERQKEDDEPEYKFEWQRKYNAPREDYAKGNAEIRDQPFGIPVRNVRCIKCHKWGHINTDKECPLFNQSSSSSMPSTSMDPLELMRQMREDGYNLKQNVLGHHMNPDHSNQQLLHSEEESDPEMDFLKSLSSRQKRKLLRKLNRLSKKQKKKDEKKKREKSSSAQGSSDTKKKKKSKLERDSSLESGSDSSIEPEKSTAKHRHKKEHREAEKDKNLSKDKKKRDKHFEESSSVENPRVKKESEEHETKILYSEFSMKHHEKRSKSKVDFSGVQTERLKEKKHRKEDGQKCTETSVDKFASEAKHHKKSAKSQSYSLKCEAESEKKKLFKEGDKSETSDTKLLSDSSKQHKRKVKYGDSDLERLSSESEHQKSPKTVKHMYQMKEMSEKTSPDSTTHYLKEKIAISRNSDSEAEVKFEKHRTIAVCSLSTTVPAPEETKNVHKRKLPDVISASREFEGSDMPVSGKRRKLDVDESLIKGVKSNTDKHEEDSDENIKQKILSTKKPADELVKPSRPSLKSSIHVSQEKYLKVESDITDSPIHPDGFDHENPQRSTPRNEAKYVGSSHDRFRNLHRHRRSPSVKHKYRQ